MKKLLFLLAGLLFSILPSSAQEQTTYAISSTGITKANELETGDYIIYVIPDGTKKPGYVNYYPEDDKDKSSRHFLTYPLDVSSGMVTDPNYVWTVTKNEAGNFSVALKNNASIYWIDDTKWGQNFTGSNNPAILTAEDSEQGIIFKPAEEMQTDGGAPATNTYINVNGPLSTNWNSLSYWGSGATPAIFTFYKVNEITAQSYPFLLSDEPDENGFKENTHWYYIKLNNRYLTYNDTEENYSNLSNRKFIYSSSTNPINYGSFWAFVKDGDNLKIYNAATGPSYVLSSDGSAERTNYPSMQEKNADGYTQSWHYEVANNETNFYLYLQGTEYGLGKNKLNCYGTSGSNPNNYLTFSTGDGDWSYLDVEYVPASSTINSIEMSQKAITGAVGTLINSDYQQFINNLEKGTVEGLVEALKIRDLTGQFIKFDVKQPYYLYALASESNNKYMKIGNDKVLVGTTISNDNASIIWKFSGDDATGFKISGQGCYLGQKTTDSQNIPVVNEDEAALYKKISVSGKTAAFYLRPDNAKGLHIDAQGRVVSWNTGGGSEWYLIPATSIEADITNVGYATVNYPFAVQLPSDDNSIKAYTGTINNSKDELILNEVENGLIPANTPVVLVSTSAQSDQTSKTYTLNIVADDTTPSISENALSGSLLSTNITTEDYILSTFNDIVGFYRLEANGALAANKAYISGNTINPTGVQGVRGFTLSFDDNNGTTTNIEDSTIAPTEEAEEYYDLQGRRVLNPTKGIYVTKSGKKVLRLK